MKNVVAALFLAAALGACSSEQAAEVPAPFVLIADATGHYCGMGVLEHDGPKGQIILTRAAGPVWFTSVRDTVAFTMLPEEPKNIAAIYVSDMGAAESWERPGAENWIDAHEAHYVIGSSRRGGMGVSEAVPFATEEAAQGFAAEHGGEIVRFGDIPADYVLGSPDEPAPQPAPGHAGH